MKWQYKNDPKLKAYGETDYDKRTIRINKQRHKKKFKRTNPNKDGSENLLDTIIHEDLHRKHPNMREKNVKKLAKAMKSKMSKKQKAKHYAKLK